MKPDKKYNIIFVGQMVQRKGIADLLTAIRLLSVDHFTVTICTRGNYDPGIAEHFSDVDMRILRNLTHPQLLQEFSKADLFVFPSLAEGFGFVILEAMHSGIPVMTTMHTCGADLINDGINGYIVPIRDPEALAAKIEYCMHHHDETLKCGLEGHKTAKEYDWSKFRNGITRVYKEMESA